jgi:hypothetical protein
MIMRVALQSFFNLYARLCYVSNFECGFAEKREMCLAFYRIPFQEDLLQRSRDSSVDIETGYGPGFDSRQGQEIFICSTMALGPTQPHIQWVLRALSLGIKRSGYEADDTHFHLVLRSRMVEMYLHFSTCLHNVVLN